MHRTGNIFVELFAFTLWGACKKFADKSVKQRVNNYKQQYQKIFDVTLEKNQKGALTVSQLDIFGIAEFPYGSSAFLSKLTGGGQIYSIKVGHRLLQMPL